MSYDRTPDGIVGLRNGETIVEISYAEEMGLVETVASAMGGEWEETDASYDGDDVVRLYHTFDGTTVTRVRLEPSEIELHPSGRAKALYRKVRTTTTSIASSPFATLRRKPVVVDRRISYVRTVESVMSRPNVVSTDFSIVRRRDDEINARIDGDIALEQLRRRGRITLAGWTPAQRSFVPCPEEFATHYMGTRDLGLWFAIDQFVKEPVDLSEGGLIAPNANHPYVDGGSRPTHEETMDGIAEDVRRKREELAGITIRYHLDGKKSVVTSNPAREALERARDYVLPNVLPSFPPKGPDLSPMARLSRIMARQSAEIATDDPAAILGRQTVRFADYPNDVDVAEGVLLECWKAEVDTDEFLDAVGDLLLPLIPHLSITSLFVAVDYLMPYLPAMGSSEEDKAAMVEALTTHVTRMTAEIEVDTTYESATDEEIGDAWGPDETGMSHDTTAEAAFIEEQERQQVVEETVLQPEPIDFDARALLDGVDRLVDRLIRKRASIHNSLTSLEIELGDEPETDNGVKGYVGTPGPVGYRADEPIDPQRVDHVIGSLESLVETLAHWEDRIDACVRRASNLKEELRNAI